MNRDSTIVQVAILLIIIAIVGVAILKNQNKNPEATTQQHITPVQAGGWSERDQENNTKTTSTGDESNTGSTNTWTQENTTTTTDTPLTENINSSYTKIVKQYFAAIAQEDYIAACDLVAWGKCNASRPISVENFSREFQKMMHGYEYVNIKDYGFLAPSGKRVVCVKYTYRYKDDPRPWLVSEIMSFYLDKVWGTTKITDRVCEKKYKAWRGLRDCPIEANKDFCIGLVK